MKGIFGGAFNPPHNEHIAMIKESLKAGLEEIIVVPSSNPPHKKCYTSFEHRRNMLCIALLGIKNVTIDDLENRDDKVHYSFETIPKLKKIYGDDLVFIMGGDSLIDFHKWKNPELIIKECPLWVFNRGNDRAKLNEAKSFWEAKGAKIKILEYEPTAISSTFIRYNIMLGFFDNIDPKVQKYILDEGLYLDYQPYIAKLSKIINEHRFYHSLGCAKYALYLNDKHKLNLDNDKVLLAGLLHDCAKGWYENNLKDKSMIPQDCISTPVEHQFLGAYIANKEFNVIDEDILNAIRYHTTGRAGMSTLEKLIYSADLLETGREEEFIIPLREEMDKDFDDGFKNIIKHQWEYLKSIKKNIYPLTIEATKYYLGEV